LLLPPKAGLTSICHHTQLIFFLPAKPIFSSDTYLTRRADTYIKHHYFIPENIYLLLTFLGLISPYFYCFGSYSKLSLELPISLFKSTCNFIISQSLDKPQVKYTINKQNNKYKANL
jgi:hypothetical protein